MFSKFDKLGEREIFFKFTPYTGSIFFCFKGFVVALVLKHLTDVPPKASKHYCFFLLVSKYKITQNIFFPLYELRRRKRQLYF